MKRSWNGLLLQMQKAAELYGYIRVHLAEGRSLNPLSRIRRNPGIFLSGGRDDKKGDLFQSSYQQRMLYGLLIPAKGGLSAA